jgi:hypothetical protein
MSLPCLYCTLCLMVSLLSNVGLGRPKMKDAAGGPEDPGRRIRQ